MKMSSKVYDILKWISTILLPALGVLYASLGSIWGWPYIEQISASIMAVVTFMNAILKISSNRYYKEQKEGDDGSI